MMLIYHTSHELTLKHTHTHSMTLCSCIAEINRMCYNTFELEHQVSHRKMLSRERSSMHLMHLSTS